MADQKLQKRLTPGIGSGGARTPCRGTTTWSGFGAGWAIGRASTARGASLIKGGAMTRLTEMGRVPGNTRPQDGSEEPGDVRACEQRKGRRSPGEKRTAAGQATYSLNPQHAAPATSDCTWTSSPDNDYHWITHCGNEFVLVDANPRACHFHFCPYCGGSIILYGVKDTP